MYGLVLAGGGAKGAYQIGVWKALIELDIEIGIVCGTSVGALNGGFVAQQKYDKAKEMWENMSMSTVFKDDDGIIEQVEEIYKKGLTATNLQLLKSLYSHVTKNRGLNIDPLRELITQHLDVDLISNSDIDYGMVTLNLTNMKPLKLFAKDVNKEDLKYYVLGSALFPGFNQDKNSPMKFFDGGIIDNLPIKMVKEKGYKDIIAVELSNKKKPNIKDINLTYIKPSGDVGNILHFNKEQSIQNITMGYLDAMKTFQQYEGLDYYFDDVPSEHLFTNHFIRLSNKDITAICSALNIKVLYTNVYVFEKMVPKLRTRIGLKTATTYKDIAFAIVELMLKELNYERLKLYNYSDVTKECKLHDFDNQLLNTLKKLI